MVSLSSPKLMLAIAVVAILDAVHAVEFFAPNWVIPMEIGTPYPSMTVNAGDSLTFAWSQGTHDVWIYPSGTCDPTGGIQVGSVQDNPTTYTFSEDEAGTKITFVCDVGAHCQAGMIMDVVVLSSAEEEIEIEEINEVEVEIEEEEELIEIEEEIEENIISPEEVDVDTETVEVAEEVIDVDGPTGEFAACNICYGGNGSITETDFVVTLPNPGLPPIEVTCAQLYQDGLDGLIPEPSCPFITRIAAVPCGCVNTDFTCNICGEDMNGPLEVKAPDALLPLPSDPTTALTCGEVASAGANGQLSVDQCGEASFFAQVPCQCTPVDFSCSVCGEGYKVTNPDAQVAFDELDVSYTCAELETAGLAGLLSPMQCVAAETYNRMTSTCGCLPEGGYDECLICGTNDTIPFSQEITLSITGMGANTCEFFYEAGKAGELGPGMCLQAQSQAASMCNCAPADFTCEVCGGGNTTMLFPEYNFTVPETGELVNCGELFADTAVTPDDCALISPYVVAECGCAPIGFTCNICGDSRMTITDADTAFIPGEETTCAEAQAAGLSGEYAPLRCAAITPFAQLGCGCVAGGTVSPVVDDVVVDEVAEAPDAPVGEEVVLPEETESTVVPTVATDAPNTTVTETTSEEESTPVEEEPATPETMPEVPAESVIEEATDAVAEAVPDAEAETGGVTLVEPPEGAVTALETGSSKTTSGSSTMCTSMATMTLTGIMAVLLVVV